MMIAVQFQVGERVRLRIDGVAVRTGTLGTIQFVYRLVPDAFEVYFDGHILPQLMRARELERVAAVP